MKMSKEHYILFIILLTDKLDDTNEEEAYSSDAQERDLKEADLKNYLQGSSNNSKNSASMSRVTSYSILATLDNKMKKGMY